MGSHFLLTSPPMAISGSNITFRYGRRFGIQRATIAASNGQLVGLIGGNGSGKTTLLKLLCGILPPQEGSILLDGQPLQSYTPTERARRIAWVPQSYAPAFGYTVEQLVMLGRLPHRSLAIGFESQADIAATEEAIALMDLQSLRHEPITQLSGGELQRALVAKSLAQGCGTLLLDEPNAHLDIARQVSVMTTLRQRATANGLCVVASIHDLNLASTFCDSLAIMSDGRVLMQGTPQEVLRPEPLSEAFGVQVQVQPNAYGERPAVQYRYALPGEGGEQR
ncbi:MAG: ABC transporter ATP-binding protein [Candidatus Kapabacteria bacterium]|nr:ABC transporter ATP-binding protein [Candidatus Kapabacteria bacterium]